MNDLILVVLAYKKPTEELHQYEWDPCVGGLPGNKSFKDRPLSEWCIEFKLSWHQSVIKLLLLTEPRFIDGSVLDCTVMQGGQINNKDDKMHTFFSQQVGEHISSTEPHTHMLFLSLFIFYMHQLPLRFLLHLCQEIFWPSHQLNTRLCLNSLHPKAAPRDDVFLMGFINARSARGAVTSTYHSVRLGSFWIKIFIFFPFQSHPRRTACRRSPFSVVSGGCWLKHGVRPSAARSLFLVFIHVSFPF